MSEKVQYELSLKDLVSGALHKMDAAVSKFENHITQTQKNLNGFGSGINTTNLLIGFQYVQQGIQFVSNIAQQAVAAFNDAEQASAQLNATLKSTGNVAGLTRSALDAQASALMKLTTYDDDAVTSAQALLATFTNIRGEMFYKTIPAVADLATKLGTDLNGAAIQVGKAMNDPTHGVLALRKAGVSFSQDQIKMIKSLQETNRLAEAQKIVLAELNKEFGGSAIAAANAGLGPLKQFQNQVGNIMETIGGGIIELSQAFIGGFDFKKMFGGDVFEFINTGLKEIIKKVVPAVESMGKVLGPIFNELFNLYARLAPVIDKLITSIIQSEALQKIGAILKDIGVFVLDKIIGTTSTILSILTGVINVIDTIYVSLERLGIIWLIEKAFEGVGIALQAIGNTIKTIYEYTLKPIFDAIGYAYDGIRGILGMSKNRGLLGEGPTSAQSRTGLEISRSSGFNSIADNIQLSASDSSKKVQPNKAITINVSIENLIRQLQLNNNSFSDNTQSMKQQVAYALVDAVNDFQIIADR